MDQAFTGILNLFVQLCMKLHDIPFILGYNLLDFLLAFCILTLVINVIFIFLGIGSGAISTVSHGLGSGIKSQYKEHLRTRGSDNLPLGYRHTKGVNTNVDIHVADIHYAAPKHKFIGGK